MTSNHSVIPGSTLTFSSTVLDREIELIKQLHGFGSIGSSSIARASEVDAKATLELLRQEVYGLDGATASVLYRVLSQPEDAESMGNLTGHALASHSQDMGTVLQVLSPLEGTVVTMFATETSALLA